MSRRAALGLGIVALWLAGLAALAHRELFRGQSERLAQAALLVAPDAFYYEVRDAGRHVGWASSTIDTTTAGFTSALVLLADRATPDGRAGTIAMRSRALLSRRLALREFTFELGEGAGPYLAAGTVAGDTLLTVVVHRGAARPDTQRVRLDAPLLLPTFVPMAIALDRTPKVGQEYVYTVFDPVANAPRRLTAQVRAESLFVVSDSAGFDAASGRWVSAHDDTVRAWRIEQTGPGPLRAWVDAKGRLVEAEPLAGMVALRSAYEIAFKNYDLDRRAAAARDSLTTARRTAP